MTFYPCAYCGGALGDHTAGSIAGCLYELSKRAARSAAAAPERKRHYLERGFQFVFGICSPSDVARGAPCSICTSPDARACFEAESHQGKLR